MLHRRRIALGDSGEEQRLIKTFPRKGIGFVGAVSNADNRAIETPASVAAAMGGNYAPPDRPSIAVLPFANMSGDQATYYFADAVVEEIVTALSRFPSLFVIARASSFTYKGRAVDGRQVGRELGVRYVLEGSVRKAANRVLLMDGPAHSS